MLSRLNHIIKRFYPSNQSIVIPGLCCVHLSLDAVSLVYVIRSGQQIELKLMKSIPYKQKDQLASILRSVVKQADLEGAYCNWVLRSEDYQLLTMESLPVPGSEFQAAIRWKVRDMLQFPIDDAVIDSFAMPLQNIPDPKKMIGVAVGRVSILRDISTKIQEAGLQLNIIDIPELALRNIAALYDEDEKGTALIYLQESESELLITSKKLLCFNRSIDVGVSSLRQAPSFDPAAAENDVLDRLALEIQRSFDYFQSQWRQPIPSRILLATIALSAADITHYLATRLALPIQVLDLKNALTMPNELTPETQGKYLLAIGGALREEGGYVATN